MCPDQPNSMDQSDLFVPLVIQSAIRLISQQMEVIQCMYFNFQEMFLIWMILISFFEIFISILLKKKADLSYRIPHITFMWADTIRKQTHKDK